MKNGIDIWEPPRDETAMESPAWHENALRESQARYDADQERIMDWQEAKKELRKRFENL